MTTGRPLTVDADLTLQVGRFDARVRSHGSRIAVEILQSGAAWKMVRGAGSLHAARNRLATIARLLRRLELTVVVYSRSRKLLTIGRDGQSGLLRLIGIPYASLHWTRRSL